MSKKGMAIWIQVAFLVLSVAIILATLPFFNDIFHIFFGKPQEDSEYQYQRIMQKVTALADSDSIYDKEDADAFYISDDYIIVGYNQGEGPSKDGCGEEDATKPKVLCGTKACICLHKETTGTDDFDDDCRGTGCNKPVQCVTFDNVDYIFSIDYKSYKSDEIPESFSDSVRGGSFTPDPPADVYPDSYAFLFLYGDCDKIGSDSFGQHPLYIERFRHPDTDLTYIMFAYPDKKMKERYEEYKEKFSAKTVRYYDREILKLVATGKHEDALKLYEEFMRIYERKKLSKETYLGLTSYIGKLSRDKAESRMPTLTSIFDDFFRLYKDEPEVADALFSLGQLYKTVKQYEEAIVAFDKIVSEYPQSGHADEARRASEALRIYKEVMKDLSDLSTEQAVAKLKAITESTETPENKALAHLKLAIIYEFSQDITSSTTTYTDQDIMDELKTILRQYNSTDYAGEAAYRLGELHRLSKDYTKACSYYSQVYMDYPYSTDLLRGFIVPKVQESISLIQKDIGTQTPPSGCIIAPT